MQEEHFHSILHLLQNPQIEESIHADIIGVTQADEDFERDSLASQSSSTTARIRLQENMSKLPHCSRTNTLQRKQEALQFKCSCYCALSVKTFSDKVEALAGEHTASSHSGSSCILSVKQMSTVKRAVRSSPHSVGSQIHASLENFSPGKRVLFDRISQKAVERLVRCERKEIMAEWVSGIDIDDTEDSVKRLAYSICPIKLIARHNVHADDFHMDESESRSATNSKMASPS
jgi:hypothetical protein